jgi:hypothetical protein
MTWFTRLELDEVEESLSAVGVDVSVERLSLTTGAWANAPSGWTNPIVVPTTLPTKFYRLFKP